MQEMIFRAPQEYPAIERLCYNANDIRMITELYSGKNSELTAVLQYRYQNILLSGCSPEVASALGKISLVEMHHLDLLGRAIFMLGGNPQLIRPAQKQYWHAGLINYTTDPCSMLLADMRDELDAADRYRSTALSCSNRPLKPLLERIALDETLHAECLQRLIRMAGCCA